MSGIMIEHEWNVGVEMEMKWCPDAGKKYVT